MYNYANLTEKELLKLVIKERNRKKIAEELLSKYETLPEVLIGATAEDLSSIKGVGKARRSQLKAINELAKRLYYVDFNKNKVRISSPRDIADLLMVDMRYLKQEIFKVIGIKLLDHVIIGDGRYKSLKESGVI